MSFLGLLLIILGFFICLFVSIGFGLLFIGIGILCWLLNGLMNLVAQILKTVLLVLFRRSGKPDC